MTKFYNQPELSFIMDVHQENHGLDVTSSVIINENQKNDNMLPIQLPKVVIGVQHLNEYCLLGIIESLTPLDMCSLAETCKQFKLLTERAFRRKFGEFGIERCRSIIGKQDLGYKFKSKTYEVDCSFQDVVRILKNFGSHLSTLKLDYDLRVVDLVAKHCSAATLKQLEIYRLTSIVGVITRLNSIRLLALHIHRCKLKIASSINWDSLIELNIDNSSGGVAIVKQTFRNLERFTWNYHHVSPKCTCDHLFDFFRRHRRLKTINLVGILGCYSRQGCYSRHLHVISSSCEDLEKLTLQLSSKDESIVCRKLEPFKKLKLLDLDFDLTTSFRPYIPLLEASTSLETIKISSMSLANQVMPVQIFHLLSELENLRELHLSLCPINFFPWAILNRLRKVYLPMTDIYFKGSDLINMISLTNLEELHVGKFFCLSEGEYSKIVRIVEPREHVMTLKCDFNFELMEFYNKKRKVKLIKLN